MYAVIARAACSFQPRLVTSLCYDTRLLTAGIPLTSKSIRSFSLLNTDLRAAHTDKANPTKLSRPLNPFVSFTAENFPKLRTENPGKNAAALLKLSAVAYKALPQADREQRTAKYRQQLQKYKEASAKEAKEVKVPLTTEERVKRQKELLHRSQRRLIWVEKRLGKPAESDRNSPSTLYLRESFKRAQLPGSGAEKQKAARVEFAEASRRFKTLPAAERERLSKEAQALNERAKSAIEKWSKQIEAERADPKTPEGRKKDIENFFAVRDLIEKRESYIQRLRLRAVKKRVAARANRATRAKHLAIKKARQAIKKAKTAKAKKAKTAKKTATARSVALKPKAKAKPKVKVAKEGPTASVKRGAPKKK